MKREKFFTTVLAILVLTGAARADTIKVAALLGTAANFSFGTVGSCPRGARCAFSGTLTIDITSGTIEAAEINFPGMLPFTDVVASLPLLGDQWGISVRNNVVNQGLNLSFSTSPTPASLVGFESGSITLGSAFGSGISFEFLDGSISTVPEPSTLALLGTGLIGLGGMLRRKLKR